MQRNVAVKDPGAGGVRFDPSDHQIPAQAAQSRPERPPVQRHQPHGDRPYSGDRPLERKAHIPRRLAYDDDGTDGRKALSIGPSGGPGDDHSAQLIVRTQKRLDAPQVGLRLDNEASRDSDSSTSHLSVALLSRYGNLRGEMM